MNPPAPVTSTWRPDQLSETLIAAGVYFPHLNWQTHWLRWRAMEGDRRRVLVLAYFFPPVGGAGVQRTLKFVKYLAELGWDATVVSTRRHSSRVRDRSLLADVPP